MLNGITTRDGRVLDQGCGIKDKKTLLEAINKLEQRRVILTQRQMSAERGNEPTTYRLNIRGDEDDGKSPPPLVGKPHQGVGGEIPPSPWGENPTTQNTGRQETGDIFRKAEPKNLDGADEEQRTAALPLTADQTVSHPVGHPHPTANGGEGSSPRSVRVAVVPQDATESAGGPSAPSPARTRVLSDPGAKFDPSETPPDQAMIGFQQLREQAMRIREEVRQRKEREKAAAQGREPGPSGPAIRKGRPPGTREEREQIAAYLGDFCRELHDEAPLQSSVTRALNAFRKANVPRERWGDYLYQARSITQERSASITKWADGNERTYPVKNKMAYYFSVLDDLLDLKPSPSAPVLPAQQS